jgi:hypothetical protein
VNAEKLIFFHEYFHFLEATSVGEVSNHYKVPIIKIGKYVLVKSGIRALSEIAAHGFSYMLYEKSQGITHKEGKNKNVTINLNESSNIITF